MLPILVLHEDHDLAAAWLAERLAASGRAVERFSGSEIAAATLWRHRLGDRGSDLCIAFGDGRTIGGEGSRAGVVNRLHYLPQAMVARLSGPDGDYARQEFYALMLSLLAALPGPMLGRPSPQGLCGPWRHPSLWRDLARRSGLPIVPWRQSASDDAEKAWLAPPDPAELLVMAVAGKPVEPDALGPDLAAPLAAFATEHGQGLCGLRFLPDAEKGWRFTGVELMPHLTLGGDCLVAAISEALPG